LGIAVRNETCLLLTGAPGVGKTTVIRDVAEKLPGVRLGGFYTAEIRVGGSRQGFRLVGFDGTERVLAHRRLPAPRVSRYGVDVAALDSAVAVLLDPDAAELFLVDEIGKMECLSQRFIAAMRRLLDSGRVVVATVALRGGGFIADVKRRSDATLWEVTRANRDALPAEVLAWIGAHRRGDT
jgi:nucleoside-triphosphatase